MVRGFGVAVDLGALVHALDYHREVVRVIWVRLTPVIGRFFMSEVPLLSQPWV